MHANLNGIDHWYDLVGATGPPVLLIMGFGMGGRAWAPQIAGLHGSHQVAFYDNRGIGETAPASRRYRLRDLASDAVALLDTLAWPSAHIVGVSMGGMIAQEVGLRHPHRVRSLSLIATHPGGRLRTIPTSRGLRLFLTANAAVGDDRLRALARLLYPPGHEPDPETIKATFDGVLDQPPPKQAVLRQLQAVVRHDTRRRLPALRNTPTLILKPARDILVRPQNSDLLHHLIPNSRLISYAEAGHALTAQLSDEVNQHLASHIGRAERSP